ncbi:MAG TPA: GH92 family glycosyl hydrolase [Candidatus Polarisedimenticolia bacterium]|jgi:predicted alpha-1,2-mannosidase
MAGAALAILLSGVTARGADDPARHVDPFIGTGGHGHTYPGATLPFGMVQLSPDTRLTGWDGCSGYHDSDRLIFGFSHTHLNGTGVSDYGDILLMPVTGAPRLENGEGRGPGEGYASRFDKASEAAGPGWYSVTLADSGVRVDLTATERTGLHRYRFPPGRPSHVIVDLAHRDTLLDSSLRAVGDREIEGFRRSTGWARDQIVHFVARFSRPFNIASLDGARGALSFGDAGGELLVKVGISAVDVDGARRNLDAEAPGWDFEAARRAARASWSEALSRIEATGGTESQRAIFYTALYHSLIAPNLFSDLDGRYRGMDHRIHWAEGRRHYTVFSLWDTFRATHPLFTILEPARTREFIETFLADHREGGRLPVWELAANETDTMIGYHAASVIADAWVKGIRGFDEGRALDAMIGDATLDRAGLSTYRRQGFLGSEDESESVSKTLEYGYDDWCIARMAAGMGREEVAREFSRRSQGWRHLFDPATGFMRPRVNQRWLEPFDPRRVDNNFTEANGWQYGFFVPHDLEGLIEALGGDDAFVARLDALFSAESATTGRQQADITGLIGQYAHGNEPSHHVAWLYHYAGRPDLSAGRVRRILEALYAARPDGLSGNEDCGQMSSWYVLSAMGLYAVCPCSDEYVIGSPIFDRITLRLEGGRRFTISAKGADRGYRYVRAASLNGRPLTRSFLRHSEIAAGGELALTLGPRPDPAWGARTADRPRSRVEGERVVAAPFVRAGAARFRESTNVELGCAEAGATIRYTLDAARPEQEWSPYSEPVLVRESSRVRFMAEREGRRSPAVEASFHRMPNAWEIDVRSEPSPQYTAGGPEALIDGLRAGSNWRTGGWQGYQYRDFEATVDLKVARPVHHAGAGFLQDIGSWIWMPSEIAVSVSDDGITFRQVARRASGVPDREEGILLRDVTADLAGIQTRYVRILARTYGEIPEWHPGHGDGAFIFVDEILID